MWHLCLYFLLLLLGQTLLTDHDPLSRWAWGSLLSTALQVAKTHQPKLARTWKPLCTPSLGHYVSLLAWGGEYSAVATASGETKSLNQSWQWHLKKRRLRRRIAFQIFGFQTYLFATPSLLTICITSVLHWDSNKVYDLLAWKNTSLGNSTQRRQRKISRRHISPSWESGHSGPLVIHKPHSPIGKKKK